MNHYHRWSYWRRAGIAWRRDCLDCTVSEYKEKLSEYEMQRAIQ